MQTKPRIVTKYNKNTDMSRQEGVFRKQPLPENKQQTNSHNDNDNHYHNHKYNKKQVEEMQEIQEMQSRQNLENVTQQVENIKPKDTVSLQNQQVTDVKFKSKPRYIPKGYQLADYHRTILFWHRNSYTKKLISQTGQEYFQDFSMFDDIAMLRHQKGIYLYLQFIKRLFFAFLILSILMVPALTFNYLSTGLSTYKPSFTLILARFTIGNLSYADQKIYLWEGICDILGMLVLFAFYLHWRSFHVRVISQDSYSKELDPRLYALSVVGFDPKTPNLEKQLKKYFIQHYGEMYEVEIVYDFNRNFKKFLDYEVLLQKLEKQKQILKQTQKSNEDLLKIEKELEDFESNLTDISTDFKPIYAFVHFQTLQAKYNFMSTCKKYSMFTSQNFKRWICCLPELPNDLKFNKTDDLKIDSIDLPKPQAINWDNLDISSGSYCFRFVLSILFIAVSILITSSLIALCSLYASQNSNCTNYNPSTTAQQAKSSNDQLTIFCFCSINNSFISQNPNLTQLCSLLNQSVLVTNIVIVGASLVSTITNVFLIFLISLIAQKIYKPSTKPSQYNFVFVTVFIASLINSTVLPLILNGDIFGFRSVSYLNFIRFIEVQKLSIFKDFEKDWFAVISPYYTNFFLISAVSPLIQFLVYFLKRRYILWQLHRKCQPTSENPTIQKQADAWICRWPIDLPVELSLTCLNLFMSFMYATLIPLAVPVFAVNLLLTFVTKKYIILNYTRRIPADETINSKIINLIPFAILIHGILGIWGRTAPGIFDPQTAFINYMDFSKIQSTVLRRALMDILLLTTSGAILVWIVFDFTIFNFVNFVQDSCRDYITMPDAYKPIATDKYENRIKGTNILGSYRLINHPVFNHPYIAFMAMMRRLEKSSQAASKLESRLKQVLQ